MQHSIDQYEMKINAPRPDPSGMPCQKCCVSNYMLMTCNWQTAPSASVHPQYPVMNLSCAFFFQWGKINNGNPGRTGV